MDIFAYAAIGDPKSIIRASNRHGNLKGHVAVPLHAPNWCRAILSS